VTDKPALSYITFDTPVGWIVIAESAYGIALLDFLGPDRPSEEVATSAVLKQYPDAALRPGFDSELLGKTKDCILEYLISRVPTPKVPLDLRKGTPFDRSVWSVIESIAFGETRSYGQVALETRSAGASRAVGRACGRNPVPIFIPCHRVIASTGKLGGYSGGLGIKKALLDLEKSAT
jgi:methylated-DNA-[protein]-cysteine S-methyltransferase